MYKKRYHVSYYIETKGHQIYLDYCDFCQCTFPDNTTNRRNHNQGTVHLNNRKLHYDWFKGNLPFQTAKKKNKKLSNLQVDPSLFLQEQLNKPPCRNYTTQGYCEFGLLCKFCHITLDPSTGKVFFFFITPLIVYIPMF